MIAGGIEAFRGKRVLLLQGPLGPFFSRLARDLTSAGASVVKVNFNGGDWAFSRRNVVNFRGGESEWPAFFDNLLTKYEIDVVMLFGDCRPIHRVAHEIAHRRAIEIGVFEEGYIRPDYITLERFGVNGHSLIPRDPAFYFSTPLIPAEPTRALGKTYWFAVLWAILYYAASVLLWPSFRHYRHHRPLNAWEGLPWLRGVWRKWHAAYRERGWQARLSGELSKRYFLVALQVHTDAQVHVHSAFESVEQFLRLVMSSFAANAPADAYLSIKHHPLDRAYHDYARLIVAYAKALGVDERVVYIHDQHLPTLLDHARGVVVINSTVGLSAIHHGTPTKVCGDAIYDLPGLSYQGGLDDFWRDSAQFEVSQELYQRFRSYVIHGTQLNGSFYRRLDVPSSAAGLIWTERSSPVPMRAVPMPKERPLPSEKAESSLACHQAR